MKKDKAWLKKEIEEYLEYEGVRDARRALEAALRYVDQLDEPETERDVVVTYFSPFTDLPVMVETETHKYMIEVTKIIEREEQ